MYKPIRKSKAALAAGVMVCLLTAPTLAQDDAPGNVYQLNMRFEIAEPMYPVHVVVNVYDEFGGARGMSEADFDGAMMSNVVCDAVACITDITVEGGWFVVRYTATGWKTGSKFGNAVQFEVGIDGSASSVQLDTSCTLPVRLDMGMAGDPAGTFYVDSGMSDCFLGDGICPDQPKLYHLRGKFLVPCSSPADIVFNVYKNSNFLVGKSTATFDGVGLTSIVCDEVACLRAAGIVAGNLIVGWDIYGSRYDGKFENETGFEIMVEGCGTFFRQLHTSCSEPIDLAFPYAMSSGGTMIFTNGCGGCLDLTVPTEEKSWGQIKSLYR